MTNPRVRIAPSPTGYLHVGTARVALANYLFARKNNGTFILRIEDTDLDRSKDSFIESIYNGLKMLGLNWDEGPDTGGPHGPYIQTERLDLYKQKAQELVDKGFAYYCYCTPEELEKDKEQSMAEKGITVYSRKCLNLSEQMKQQYIAESRVPTIRFKVPDKDILLKDIIKGEIPFDSAQFGDFVILKSNGTPTYNFAVVVDDVDMEITQVIRGEDHISNTPRQIMLYEAFERPVPLFAHMPMILAPDRTKLSKRHGATAVSDFIDQGYLPEAFVNFLALMGWSSPDGEEIFSLEKLINSFELERVSPAPAIFDKEKLNWVNGMYIRSLTLEDICNRSKKFLQNYDLSKFSQDKYELLIKVTRERVSTLGEIPEAISFFFGEDITIPEEVKAEALSGEHVKMVLEKFLEFVEKIDFENIDPLEEQFKEFRKSLKPLKPKDIMMPVRAALTGQLHGADLSVCIFLLGKDLIKHRVNKVLC